MHKILTKTLFLGKKVIYLPSCHSTNDIAQNLAADTRVIEGTLVVTGNQLKGRGQRGNTWVSEPDANLTFSLILTPRFLPVARQFYLNICFSLAISDLVRNTIPYSEEKAVAVKWPNDVYISNNKTAGILIENSLKKSNLEQSIAGVGLNVNQKAFGFKGPTSLYLESGEIYDLPVLLEELVRLIEKRYLQLRNGEWHTLKDEYLQRLYWKDELRLFRSEHLFEGRIRGVDNEGHLLIETERGLRSFGIKDVQFIE
ncbi:biotin--[acetyl-CoA-carboxylase] ligase [Roseivirga sp. BDSF3-8]|uniref:biotin--[acetyl-CoA-carboxylase] ligase n=1 Tax=Roseivirga sp. BDSF3-8 TaxID=3241598 RepID=UPI0035322585